MKMKSNYMKLLVKLLVVTMICVSCSFSSFGHSIIQAKIKTAVKLNKKKLNIKVGKTAKLKLKNAKAKKIKWKSSNKSVAKVSSSGKVKGIKAGKAKITAKYGKKKYVCKVTVKGKKNNNSGNLTNPGNETSDNTGSSAGSSGSNSNNSGNSGKTEGTSGGTGNSANETNNSGNTGNTSGSSNGTSGNSDKNTGASNDSNSSNNSSASNESGTNASDSNNGSENNGNASDSNIGSENSGNASDDNSGDSSSSESSSVTSNAKKLAEYIKNNGYSGDNGNMSIDFTGTTHNGNAVTTVIAYDESAGLLVFSASHSDGTNLYYDYDISKGCAVSNKIYYSGMTPNGKSLDGTGEYNISTYKDMEQLTFSLDGMDHSAIFDEFCSEYVGLATRAWLLQIREALGFSLADIGYSSF